MSARREEVHRDNITQMFRLATSRSPSPRELEVLSAGLDRHLTHYRFDRAAAMKLVKTGEYPRDPSLDTGDRLEFTGRRSPMRGLVPQARLSVAFVRTNQQDSGPCCRTPTRTGCVLRHDQALPANARSAQCCTCDGEQPPR